MREKKVKVKGRRQDFIPINEIDIGNRLRSRQEDIGSLVTSVRKKGVLQPILVVRKSSLNSWLHTYRNKMKDGRKPYLLIAGNHRIQASLLNELTHIPAYIIEEDIPLWKAESMELDENIERKPQGWVSEAFSIAEIHKAYIKQKRKPTSKHDTFGHHDRDTALALGYNIARVRESLDLVEAFKKWPNLKFQPSRHSAYELLKKLRKREDPSKYYKDLRSGLSTEKVLPVEALPKEDSPQGEGPKRKRREIEEIREHFREGLIIGADSPEEIDRIRKRAYERIKERFIFQAVEELSFEDDTFHLVIVEAYSPMKTSFAARVAKPGAPIIQWRDRKVLTEEDYILLLRTFTNEGDLVLVPDSFDGSAIFSGLFTNRVVFAATQSEQGWNLFNEKIESGYPYE